MKNLLLLYIDPLIFDYSLNYSKDYSIMNLLGQKSRYSLFHLQW